MDTQRKKKLILLWAAGVALACALYAAWMYWAKVLNARRRLS